MNRRMGIGAAVAVVVLVVGWSAATTEVPAQPELPPVSAALPRRFAGPLPCRADEALRLAADAEQVLRAAGCAESGELADDEVFPAYRAAQAAIEALAARGAPAEDLASIAELASDQQHAGSLVQVAAWTAVQSIVLDVLEARPPEEVARVAPRLEALAAAELDLSLVHAREERSMWGVLRRMVVTPSAWPELPLMPLQMWYARTGTHPSAPEILAEVSKVRARAAALGTVR